MCCFVLSVARYFILEETLATIGEKLCVELSQCLSEHGHGPYSPERQVILKGQILAIARPDNTVRKVMGTYCLKLCLTPYTLTLYVTHVEFVES